MNIVIALLMAAQWAVIIVWGWILGVAFVGTRRGRGEEKPVQTSQYKLRFAVLICAHNEENVIAGILESLREQTYPADCKTVYLIADRCTDHTCQIAQQYDFVTVLPRDVTGESGKGLALKWGIEKVLEKESGNIDAIMVLDADNRVSPQFLELFNERFCQGSLLITGKRVAMNPYDTLVSKWYAIYWSMVTELFCYSRRNLSLSALLSGTGFAFSVSLLGKEGFHTFSMSEDIEFSVQQNLKGIRVDYLEDAVYFDEQPVSFPVMYRQLRRWTTGSLQIVRRYTGKLVKKLYVRPSIMLWDSFLTLLLCGNMGVVFAVGLGNWWLGMARGGFWTVNAFIQGTALGAVTLIIAIIAARKSRLDVGRLMTGIVLFPVFCLLLSGISLCSFFRPQRKWHKIEHYGTAKKAGMEK